MATGPDQEVKASSTPPAKPEGAAAGAAAKPGEYHVARAIGICAVSGRIIAPGEKLYGAVRETTAGLERLNVAPENWDAWDKTNLLAFWLTTMPESEAKKKVFLDDEVLCTLFERLADATEPAKINFRWVLGLILIRKRLVVYDSSRVRDGNSVWVVRLKGKDEKMDLVDPKLDENQMIEVSQQLGQILNEEL